MSLVQMPLDTVARYIPSHMRMREALEALGRADEFTDGEYQRVFFRANGYSQVGSEHAWARAYIRNRRVLEYAAQEAYSVGGLTSEKASRLTIALAAKHAGMSAACVTIGVAPSFEDFLERNAPGQVPRRPFLATTARQVSYMQATLDVAGPRFPSLFALNRAKSIEGYMLTALTFAMFPGYDQNDHDKFEYSANRYRATVYQWLGKSYESALTAVRFAKLGATPGDIQGYAQAGLSVEYATALF